MTQRVLDQDVENLSDEPRGADHRVNDAGRDDDLASLLGELILPVGHVMVHECREVEFGPFAGGAPACHTQQLVERRVELVDLAERCGRLMSHFGIVVALKDLESHGDPGEAGPQLMRGIGGEPSFRFKHTFDSVSAEPNRTRDTVDLCNPGW